MGIGIDEALFEALTKYCNESDNLEDDLKRAELLGFGGRQVKVAPGAIIRVRDKNAIGQNINQIAHKANEINSIYAGDYEKMREEYETLCRMLSVKLSIQE